MKIIIFNDFGHVRGGQDQVAIASAVALVRLGTEVTFCAAVGPISPELIGKTGLETICFDQTDILHKNKIQAVFSGLRNQEAISRTKTLLASFDRKDTVVHFHGYQKAFSPALVDFVLRQGFKVVLTLHDYFLKCPNGAFFEFPQFAICHRKPLGWDCVTCRCDSRNYSHKVWRVARTVYQNKILHLEERVHQLITVSSFSRDILFKDSPGDSRVTVLSNPLEVENLGPAPVALNRRFLFIGRFVVDKGVDLFAEAVNHLGCEATFIGEGPMAEELMRKCPGATFTGWLTSNQIVEHLRQSRCLVFPSRWYEAQPLTPAEALAQGVPVITSNANAATGFVRDGVNGLHFENGNGNSLIEKMRKIMDSGTAEKLGAEAHKLYWENPWSLERHAEGLTKIYRDLIQNDIGV